MATDDDWDSYARAVIDMAPPDRSPFRVVPDRAGDTDRWPGDIEPPVVVITAWNPDSIRLPLSDNQARNRRLAVELDELGVTHWAALGRDLDSPHHEEGFAVVGLTEADGVALGRRHGQAAVYIWTPASWSVLSCTDSRRRRLGWRLTVRPVAMG